MDLNKEILVVKEQIERLGRWQKREKAELLFVLAVLYAKNEQKGLAINMAEGCLELLDKLSTGTLEDCAATTAKIGSVYLPELFHQGTVREHMKHYGIIL